MTSPLPDSVTRNRSDSGEDNSLPGHDRKRPRLSEGSGDASQHLPDLNSAAQRHTASDPLDQSLPSLSGLEVSSKPSLPPATSDAHVVTSSPTSKVTINTRPLSSQSMVNHIPPSIDGTSEVIDVVLAPDKASSSNKPDLDPDTAPASTHETISISSSPVGSPEIEIAEVEDYDQDPSQTRWTGRVGGATTSRSIQPFYMRSTFPHAREYKVGDARLAVSRLAKSLGEPARDPGAAFVQVKAWLTAFLDACDDLTEAIYEEDVGFWSRLHQIPEALLKREQHSLTTVSLTELIDFFLAWGRLTQLMFRLELRRCAAILQGTEKIEKLALGTSWAYLIPITWLLGEKCTLLGSLQKHHRLDPMLIIKPCFHQLMHPKEINLVKSITDLVSEMIPVFHKSHRFIKDVGLLSIPLGNLLGLLGLVSISLDLGEADVSAALDNLREGLEASLTGIDRLLQESIRKQSPWLTMDTGSELVHQMQDLFGKLGAEVPGFARQLICASGVSVDDADYTYLELVANHAWKFTIWHKFLRHGRMELRVCGVDRMCGELVIVFTNFIRDSADGRQNPLVKYLNRFLRENEIIPYVISAESHPQIIQRSANLVGFLSVSHTYTTADTDIIWNAAIEGEDPRTNQEILALLQRCFETAEEAHVVYVCQKLLTLASSRFDTRMLDFARSALVALRDKAQNHHAFSQYFNAPASYDPVGRILCLRLIRVVNALHSKLEYWPIFQDHFVQLLPTFLQASREQGRCLAVSEEEEDDILEAIRRDIEAHAEASMGAIVVVNCMLHLKMLLEDSKIFVIDRCGLPQALVDEIAVLSANLPRETFQVRPYIDPPLTCLSHCLTLVPEKFTDTHLDSLWCSVLTGQSVHPDLRNHAWEILISIIRYSRQPNPAINRILSHYWPKLQPSDFSKAVLDFAVQSIAYETAISSQTMVAPGDVVVIPGIERVWTIMLDAPSGTVETEATDFVIGQYLRSQLIVKAPRESVRATQLKLIDRCVNQVLGSASRLKSFAEVDFRSDPDESTVIIASAEEIHIEESRFDRSLLFLRRFTEAVKVNPTCSPIASRQFDGLPEFPKKKGESLEFKVQIFGNKYLSEAQRSVSVGKANTGADLWEYLSKISGFSSFAVINNGKSRTDLQEETSTLEDLKIARGALFVRKIENTVEAMPRARLRQCSPVDEKIILHFDDLYGLLESDDRLAKEVYDFLNITTVKEKVSQLARSMETPALELLSSDKPYKLLFSAQALRSPVEQESFNNNSPDGEFLSYAVKAIITAFMRLAGSDFVGALSKTIAQELLDTLLMAFRAKVPTEVSREFLSGYDGFLDVILKYFVAILGADGQELQRIKVHEMTQAAFEVLVEARLQNESSWGQLTNDETVRGVFAAALLFDNRESVRQSILDVVLGLTGATGSKLVPKPDSRAARARYDSTTIESTLKQVWELIVEVLPMTDRHNAQCQQLFDTALVILRRIGKSFELDLLQSLFEQWSEALLRHEGYEIVGQPMRDRFVPGIVKLVHECAGLLLVNDALPPQPKLMRKIISKFLFPPLHRPLQHSLANPPILESSVRENLYDLLILMCQTPTDVFILTKELSEESFTSDTSEFHVTHDRQALRTEVGYAGLRNLSNTCYLNSLFSQLFMNVQFRQLLFNTSIVDYNQQKLLWELGKVFAEMQGSYKKSIEPTEAVDSIVTYEGGCIDVSVQMDVDEFFNLLFDRLEGQILDQKSKQFFKSLYGGQTIQQIKSKECEHVSERPEAFSVLPVEIKEKFRLEDSLKAYVEGELLQGDNKYSCTSCGRLVDAVKRSCLKEVPDNLIFNLKRFDYDIITGLRCKLNDHFAFPDSLDMAPYTLEQLSRPDVPAKPDVFELTGIIVHSGTADSGHYFSYTRQRPSAKGKNDSWVQFNDSDVTPFPTGQIANTCFGGVDPDWNNVPKFYNAYMLFYQRSSSIQQTQNEFMHVDELNPIRLRTPIDQQERIDKENGEYLRSYCSQDPVHARFVRQLVERLFEVRQGRCSDDHDVETETVRLALNYMHTTSSRWKTQPEMEATAKLLVRSSEHCVSCAYTVVHFFASTHGLRDCIVKSAFQATRKTFMNMLRTCLGKFRDELSGSPQTIQLYHNNVSEILLRLRENFDVVERIPRAWFEYFGVLMNVVDLGLEETSQVMEVGFFEQCAGLVHLHYSEGHELRSDRKIKAAHQNYQLARERNRSFNHTPLIALFARIIFRLDLKRWSNGSRRRVNFESGLIEPSINDVDVLGLKSSRDLSWLRRIIAGRTSPAIADQLVGYLTKDRELAGAVSGVIGEGLEHKSMPTAVAFLQPLVVFCSYCPSEIQISDLLTRFMESVATIGLEYGKEYFQAIQGLMQVENEVIPFGEGHLADCLAEQLHQWAPVLLVALNDMTMDVRSTAMELVQTLLFQRMELAQSQDSEQFRMLQHRAMQLAKSAADYVQSSFLNSNSGDNQNLQPRHAQQISQVVDACVQCVEFDNADDEQQAEDIQRVMFDFRTRAEQAVETLSTAEWAESSEIDALSEEYEDVVSP